MNSICISCAICNQGIPVDYKFIGVGIQICSECKSDLREYVLTKRKEKQ